MVKAQVSERTSAWNYLNKGKLDKAKASIDKCIAHESTMADAKTWFYRGNIYLSIRLSEDTAYRKLEPNALQVSYDSYTKAISLDTKKEYLDDINQRLMIVGEQFYNIGVENFQAKKYDVAIQNFENTVKINQNLGKADTLAMYNVAFVAEMANDLPKAKQYYQELIKINYKQPLIYASLSNIYRTEKDTAMALQIIQRGRTMYPDDFSLLITETNIYLAKNDIVAAQKNLNQAIEKDPTNPTIYFAVGTTYDQMGRVEDAEKAYLKAIELKPDMFDAIYNLGALYFNQGVKIFEEADKLTDMTLYAKEKEKYEAAWRKALPQLEKALELMPNDVNTIYSLKQLYARLNMPEKAKIMSERLDKAEGK
jgi:tetratricopeptide (TPR) repeat protein